MDRLVAEDLVAFAVFAAHRNFTRAAAELRVSQPALHTRIRKLGEHLGTPLYAKYGRQLRLTEAGERLAAFANDSRALAEAFRVDLGAGPRRPICLVAGAGAYRYLLGDAIRRALAKGYELRLSTADARGTVGAVRDGAADLGVTALGVLPDDLSCEPLGQYPQVLVVRPDHRLAGRRTVRLRDLGGESLVVPPKTRPHRRALERSMLDQGVEWSVAVEAEGWDLLVHFVRLGVGAAVINGSVRTGAGLVTVPVSDLPPVRYYLLTRADRPADSRLDAIRKMLV